MIDTNTTDLALPDDARLEAGPNNVAVPGMVLAPGGSLRIEEEWETVYTDRPARNPDLKWKWVHGLHTHAWLPAAREGYPPRFIAHAERRVRHYACDGACGDRGCEGYDVDYWVCGETGEEFEPGTVEGPRSASFQRGRSVTLSVMVAPGWLPGNLIEDARIRCTIDGKEAVIPLPPRMHPGDMTVTSGEPPVVTYTGEGPPQ